MTNLPYVMVMKERWLALTTSLGIEETTAVALYADLAAHYEAEGRHYHNLAHVQYMLEMICSLPAGEYDKTAVQLAVWFHDVIYNPQRLDNEKQSAAYARQCLAPWLPPALVDEVVRLILLTAGHETTATDANGSVLLDADLATLGADPAVYDRYSAAIRREYAWVPEEIYRRERAKLLARFLQKERIFNCDTFRERFEERARQNLRRELANLGR